MSSPSALQCLFCNHLNPGGATFCNDCGSQLQLQQCDLCGSINKRSARSCYKCGAPFNAQAAHGGYFAIDSGHAGDVLWPEQSDQTTLPESAARALGARREFQGAALAVPDDGDCSKVAAASLGNAVPGCLPDAAQPIDLALCPEAAATTGFRYLYSIAWSVLAAALVFLSVYYYRGPPSPDWAETGVEQAAPTAPPDEPASAGATSAAPPSPAGAVPENTSLKPSVFRVLGAFEEVSSRPDAAAKARPEVAGGTAAAQNVPAQEPCREAIVALGLCGAPGKQEKP